MKKQRAGFIVSIMVLGLLVCDIPIGASAYTTKESKSDSIISSERKLKLKGLALSYTELGKLYEIKGKYVQALEYDSLALLLFGKLKDRAGTARVYNNIGVIHADRREYALALDYYFKALKINESIGNKADVARNLGNIAVQYEHTGDYRKALEYNFKALELAKETGNKSGVASDLGNMGIIYSNMGNYSKAINYDFDALKIQEELNDKLGRAHTLGNLGVVYQKLNDFSKAMEYYQKSLKLNEELGNINGVSLCLENISGLYTTQKKYNLALAYCQRGLKIAEKVDDPASRLTLITEIGKIQEGQGDSASDAGNRAYALNEKYPKALASFNKSLEISRQIGLIFNISQDYADIAGVELKLGKYKEAKAHLLFSLIISDSVGLLELQKDQHRTLSEVYSKLGEPAKSLEQYKLYTIIKDSIYALDKNKEITRKELVFEFDKKEAAFKGMLEKKELLYLAERQKYQILIISGCCGVAFLLTLVFMVYKSKLQKRAAQSFQTELKFLKNQINPHFLFNVMNSIYILSQTNSKMASEIIMKLSQILRYQLYECSTDRVPLLNEIDCLKNYIEIQEMRSGHKLKLNFILNGNAEGVFIAPMILMTFIENAFKFGVEPALSGAFININLTIAQKRIHFVVENSIPLNLPPPSSGGIGLMNVKRRLDLLYRGKHQFKVKKSEGRFLVELTLSTRKISN